MEVGSLMSDVGFSCRLSQDTVDRYGIVYFSPRKSGDPLPALQREHHSNSTPSTFIVGKKGE
jgi:hypothetical protein